MSEDLKTFKVVSVLKHGNCKTKFNKNKYYYATTSRRAAKIAFTHLCRVKKIKGVCAFNIKLKDATRKSKNYGKIYNYHVNRKYILKSVKNGNIETIYKCAKIRTYSLKNKKNEKFTKNTQECQQTSGIMKKYEIRK